MNQTGRPFVGGRRKIAPLCVESYVGRLGGHEGVKLEEQVLITDTGSEVLSTYPFDPMLDS